MQSRLLDMRECNDPLFKKIHCEILKIAIAQQPPWFEILPEFFKRLIEHDFFSRRWEYPWAVLAADIKGNPYRTLDVGGGGSPFPLYLQTLGCDSYVIDPSLDHGSSIFFDPKKGIFRNIRSMIFNAILKMTGLKRLWGKPLSKPGQGVKYYTYSAADIKFPDRYFDRVFCLSVLEHIPVAAWDQCLKEFERVLKPGGRLVITFDMSTPQADQHYYLNLLKICQLKLIGDPQYSVPISMEDKRLRHPECTCETIGLVWQG